MDDIESRDDAYQLFESGRRFLAQGHPGQAVALLLRAQRLEPSRNSIREALGRAQFALGEFEAAAEQFAELLRRAPTNDYAHFALGCSLARIEQPDRALGHLRLAAAMAPNNEDYRRGLEEFLKRAEQG